MHSHTNIKFASYNVLACTKLSKSYTRLFKYKVYNYVFNIMNKFW